MSAAVVQLVVAGLLLIELVVAARHVRRHAVAADAAITDEEYRRAADNATDFLTGLSRSERLQVARSVWRGRVVTDPALAPAATAVGHATWLKCRMSVARPRWIVGSVGLLWGWIAASRLTAADGAFWQVLNVVILLASPWIIHDIVVGPLRRSENAVRAERSNLAVVAGQSGRGAGNS